MNRDLERDVGVRLCSSDIRDLSFSANLSVPVLSVYTIGVSHVYCSYSAREEGHTHHHDRCLHLGQFGGPAALLSGRVEASDEILDVRKRSKPKAPDVECVTG